ncbi:Protein of unknown function (DUF1115) [Fragilaria crotonensis]|nr:Protein of unknown function (DUF1115) [Fragilaria crotonensis]
MNVDMEQIERAVLEIEALQAIYEDKFTVYSKTKLHDTQIALAQYHEDPQTQQLHCESHFAIPELEIGLGIIDMDHRHSSDNDTMLQLHFCLPPGYPESSPARVRLSHCVKFSKKVQDDLCVQLNEKAHELIGHEAILLLVQELQEVLDQLSTQDNTSQPDTEYLSRSATATAGTTATTTSVLEGPATLHKVDLERRWIWAHHILDPARRKSIVKEALDLGLGGYLKPGYPGIVVVEGDASACEEFVHWIKGNKSRPGGFGRNWGHHVKGELRIIDRILLTPFRELDEGMKELGALCKEHGLNDEFLEYVMQQK